MKKLLLFLLGTSCFVISNAQSNVYKNFPDTNFVWVENFNGAPGWIGCCCGGICVNDDNYQYFFDGDTTYNSYTYSKFYKTGATNAYIAGMPNCPPWCNNVTSTYTYYSHQYVGALRHDSVARKVYMLNGGQDELYYDFNMQVGDSARCFIGNGFLNYVSSIDSVQVGSQFHKRFWLTTWNGHQLGYDSAYAFIVEGIGSSQGLTYTIAPLFEFIGTLICAYDNSVPVYPANQPGCPIPTGKEELLPVALNFTLVPNPATGNVRITGGESGGTITITDVQGKIIYNGRCTGETTDVKLAGIPKGVYAVKLTNTAGQHAVKKLVIE